MRNQSLVLLVLALLQVGCEAEELYHPFPETSEQERQRIEQIRRDLLQLTDLKIGEGSVATWGRKIVANVVVRYADGSLVYEGPIVDYIGFMENPGLPIPYFVSPSNSGIMLGIHGMAIGGRRRIVVDPSLVCDNGSRGANPKVSCSLIHQPTPVRKEQLVVEAVLVESCIPVGSVMTSALGRKTRETGCRRSEFPRLDLGASIWHVY